MYKKLLFLTFFVLVLSLVSISYGADTRMIKLEFNKSTDNNDANTEEDFTKFIIENSGSEVNGVVIDLSGILRSDRRDEPNGPTRPTDPYLNFDLAFRDFVYAIVPSGVTITLYGLGVNRECDITMWAYDHGSTPSRLADWWATWGDVCDANYMFTTDFNGGLLNWPPDIYWYWAGTGKTDYLGRLILTSTIGPNSPSGQPFAFVNALVVEPKGTFTATNYSQRPVPFDGTQTVPVNTVLKWRKGASVSKHDLYLGTNETAVTDATRATHPGVLAALDLATDANSGYDPCGAGTFIKLDTTYYWRVDENSPGSPQGGWKGETWSFKTLPYHVAENFDRYPPLGSAALKAVWNDYGYNGSSAEVWPEEATVRGVASMRYDYENYTYPPYYSEANATVVSALGMDPNWLGMEAKSLSLWFYGDPCNPVGEHDEMYIKLGDSPDHNATVFYSDYGDLNDVKEESWHEWNIPLADFSGVNLSNVWNIVIGFGDGNRSTSDGIVYFEDVRIYATRCVLAERDPNLALADYAPAGAPAGDCVVDNQELLAMADTWLVGDQVFPTKNPNDVNLVLYYPLNEGDGNKVYPAAGSGGKSGDLGLWTGTMWNRTGNDTYPIGTKGVFWSTDHAPGIGGSACLYINGEYGSVVECGTYGQAALGIGALPGDVNAITLSVWVKPLGPRSWDSYLAGKFMGLLGKRGGWSEETVIWMFSVTPSGQAFCFTSRPGGLYSASVLTPFFGKWVHLAATYPHPSGDVNNPSDVARIYLNGDQVNSGAFRFSYGIDANIMLSIGCTMDINAWPSSCPESFYGYIDEVRIYDRVLEPNEIAYLADTTPEDGYLQIPPPSSAEVYTKEPVGQQMVNFKDFALVAEQWLKEDMYP